MKKTFFWYLCLMLSVLVIDRITKIMALAVPGGYCTLHPFVAIGLVFNRGFSWSMFHSDGTYLFVMVSSLIIIITSCLAVYAYRRFMAGYAIVGESLVLAGSLSNIIDRFLYGGVVDFLILSYGDWSWPAFNAADAAIVIGACIMFWHHYE